MGFYIDQTNHQIQLKNKPQRIISLVPSQTEMLHYFGLENEVVGITKFCIHPYDWYRSKERVGGTKNLNIEKIKSLTPDLIIGNKEENVKEQIESLRQSFPVWLSDVNTLEDGFEMMQSVGQMTGKVNEASALISKIEKAKLKVAPSNKRVLYFIWNEPMMVAGKNTFIDSMLNEAGFQNVVTDNRYPEMSFEDIEKLRPEYIFLSSEPFPFKGLQQKEFQKMFPFAQVELVDGELFSWYGSRLLKSYDYFREINERLARI